jgi:hypothetical protein
MTERTENVEFLWGADAIAKAVGRSSRSIYHLLEAGKITPARKKCGRWVVERNALIKFLMEEAA